MKLFLIAGEASGDRLGAALMAGLRHFVPDMHFAGVGGRLMQQQGMESLFPMAELSLMGIIEILPKYFHLKRRIRQTAQAVMDSGADALVTIDSPDFCLRVARLVKKQRPGMRVIHYVAPSVWAWRAKRAAKMAQVVDHVLALLPFEPPYMTAAGMSCDFVGHPIVAEALAGDGERAMMQGSRPMVLALPGSRMGEIDRLMGVMGQTMAQIRAHYPDLRVVLPTLPHLKPHIETLSAAWDMPPDIITDDAQKRGAFAVADMAFAASGTVSLELAAYGCPMVIGYDMNRLSLWLMRRFAYIDTVTLVNLITQSRIIPEFIGPDCRANLIVPAMLRLLQDEGARAQQRAAMAIALTRLGLGGTPPNMRAAQSVLHFLRAAPDPAAA